MKTKHFLITAVLALTSVASFSQVPPQPGNDPLPFGITGPGDDHSNTGGSPLPKTPIQIPEVYLDGHTLSFDAAIEGCEVRLLDENENVVFKPFIIIYHDTGCFASFFSTKFAAAGRRGGSRKIRR